jgi:hypothetical protein
VGSLEPSPSTVMGSFDSGQGYIGVATLDRGESARDASALESGGGKAEFRGGIVRRREDTPLPGLGSHHLNEVWGLQTESSDLCFCKAPSRVRCLPWDGR